MPFSYVVYAKHRLVISTGSDLVTWKEIRARQDQTKTDPEFNPEFNQLVDLRAVTGFDMTSDQARTNADLKELASCPKGGRTRVLLWNRRSSMKSGIQPHYRMRFASFFRRYQVWREFDIGPPRRY